MHNVAQMENAFGKRAMTTEKAQIDTPLARLDRVHTRFLVARCASQQENICMRVTIYEAGSTKQGEAKKERRQRA